jgi:hypothetical protein
MQFSPLLADQSNLAVLLDQVQTYSLEQGHTLSYQATSMTA